MLIILITSLLFYFPSLFAHLRLIVSETNQLPNNLTSPNFNPKNNLIKHSEPSNRENLCPPRSISSERFPKEKLESTFLLKGRQHIRLYPAIRVAYIHYSREIYSGENIRGFPSLVISFLFKNMQNSATGLLRLLIFGIRTDIKLFNRVFHFSS